MKKIIIIIMIEIPKVRLWQTKRMISIWEDGNESTFLVINCGMEIKLKFLWGLKVAIFKMVFLKSTVYFIRFSSFSASLLKLCESNNTHCNCELDHFPVQVRAKYPSK